MIRYHLYHNPRTLRILAVAVAFTAVVPAAWGNETEAVFTPFDAAPFGTVEQPSDGTAYGVRWGKTRKVQSVVVEFAEGSEMPAAETLRVQYWHRHWNGKADPIVRYAAAGSGWAPLDDWTNGGWKEADAKVSVEGRKVTFTFAPSGEKEFPNLGSPGVPYRKTLKIRVAADRPLPQVASFQALTASELRPSTMRILWGKPACAKIATPATGFLPYRSLQRSRPRGSPHARRKLSRRRRRNVDRTGRCERGD